MDWRHVSLLGVDVGFSNKRPTTGFAIYENGKLQKLCRIHSGPAARASVLHGFSSFDVVAIDGPILPHDADPAAPRIAESLLSRGLFQRRCKPAASHFGLGLILREATRPFVEELGLRAKPANESFGNNQVVQEKALVEAFPNSFLGVLLDDGHYRTGRRLKRGQKFDWLYEQALQAEVFDRLLKNLEWNDDCLLGFLETETDHEKRAALICLLTAAFAFKGSAQYVGDKTGGWICLPPKRLWAAWACEAAA